MSATGLYPLLNNLSGTFIKIGLGIVDVPENYGYHIIYMPSPSSRVVTRVHRLGGLGLSYRRYMHIEEYSLPSIIPIIAADWTK